MRSLVFFTTLIAISLSAPQQDQFQGQFQDQFQSQGQPQFQDQPQEQFPQQFQGFQGTVPLRIPSNENLLAYVLPAGFEEIVSNLQMNFNCEGKSYGYYADVDNDCKVFHVCNPVMSEDGEVIAVDQFSFLCGNQTVFSQDLLACTYVDEALPCQEASNFFDIVNAEFFREAPAASDNAGRSFDSQPQENFQQTNFQQQNFQQNLQ